VNLVKGAVGSGAATSFLQYLRQLRIPDPEAVLDGAAQVDPTLREDELLVLFERDVAPTARRCPKTLRTKTLRTKSV
jgi:hypothetical protein